MHNGSQIKRALSLSLSLSLSKFGWSYIVLRLTSEAMQNWNFYSALTTSEYRAGTLSRCSRPKDNLYVVDFYDILGFPPQFSGFLRKARGVEEYLYPNDY